MDNKLYQKQNNKHRKKKKKTGSRAKEFLDTTQKL